MLAILIQYDKLSWLFNSMALFTLITYLKLTSLEKNNNKEEKWRRVDWMRGRE